MTTMQNFNEEKLDNCDHFFKFLVASTFKNYRMSVALMSSTVVP